MGSETDETLKRGNNPLTSSHKKNVKDKGKRQNGNIRGEEAVKGSNMRVSSVDSSRWVPEQNVESK